MAEIKFHYFDGYGRGEVVRFILRHLAIQFEDVRYTYELWYPVKATGVSEFGQLPMLEIDGRNLVQSRAIEKYLLRRAGLLSNDPLEAYQSESIVGFVDDVCQIIAKFVWVDKDLEALAKWNQEQLPEKLRLIEKRLNEANTHIVGNTLSHADFVVFEWLYDYFLRPNKAETMRALLETSSPRLFQYAENFKNAHVNLAAYLATREEKQF